MTVLPVLLALIRARVAHPTYDWLRDTVAEIDTWLDALRDAFPGRKPFPGVRERSGRGGETR